MLDLKFSKTTLKFLKRCDNDLYKRIINKIKSLQINAFPADSKRIKGKKDKTFKVRIGNYKILYCIYNEKNLLFISDIDKRSKAYN